MVSLPLGDVDMHPFLLSSFRFRYLMDDEQVMRKIDFAPFEEQFKLNPVPIKNAVNKNTAVNISSSNNNNNSTKGNNSEVDSGKSAVSSPKQQLDTLMEHTRLKNMAICKRKLPNLPISELVRAVNSLDINVLPMETVELLQRMVPLEAEVRFAF